MLAYSGRESACFVQQATKDTPWPIEQQLQAIQVDALQAIDFRLSQFMWMYGSAHGQKGRPQPQPPKPFPRPGVQPALPAGTQHVGSDPIPAADFAQFWNDPGGYDDDEEEAA